MQSNEKWSNCLWIDVDLLYYDLVYSLYSNTPFILFLALTFMIISYFTVFTISGGDNFIKSFLRKYFFNTWVFNYWKNNKTISGKTYLKRKIILFVLLDIIFLEFLGIIPEQHQKWVMYYFIIAFMIINTQLNQDVRRINAVFLNNISLRRITFNLILFFYVIIYYDYFLIQLLPNDYPNLSEIGLLILIAIQFYLIVKNSPITDSKQHEG